MMATQKCLVVSVVAVVAASSVDPMPRASLRGLLRNTSAEMQVNSLNSTFSTDQQTFGATALQSHYDRDSLYVLGFKPYFSYTGSLDVSGTLWVKPRRHGHLDIGWEIDGADANCGQIAYESKSNDCGIHIHEGMDCNSDAGGHLWKPSSNSDPWKSVHYKVHDSGRATEGGRKVRGVGLTIDDAVGHAVVVHNISGGRIACGILQTRTQIQANPAGYNTDSPLKVRKFSPYPGSMMPYTVEGVVEIKTVEYYDDKVDMYTGVQFLSWSFKGGDHNCGINWSLDGVKSNDCGIHIHAGTTCDNAEGVGGHLYKTETDPWKFVHYKLFRGKATQSGFRVEAMLTQNDIEGHAVVIHDAQGRRIACGLIEKS
jgi:hypothetical protein